MLVPKKFSFRHPPELGVGKTRPEVSLYADTLYHLIRRGNTRVGQGRFR